MSSTKSRKDTRAVVALLARYRSPATFEYVQDACCDVSVGGMFIKSDSPAAAGTLIKLECETDGDGAKIRGVARVVWLRREPNEHGPTGMGVKFVKLESGSKDVITKLVQRLAEAGVEPRSISAPPENSSRLSSASSGQPKAQPSAPSPTQPKAQFGTIAQPKTSSGPSSKPAKPAAGIAGTSGQPATGAATSSAATAAVTGQLADASGDLAQASAVASPNQAAAQPDATQPAAEPSAEPVTAAEPEAIATSPIAQPPEATTDGPHDSLPRAPRKGSAVRVWIGVVVCVAVLLAIIFADDGPTGSNPASGAADTPVTALPTPVAQPNTAPPAEPSPTPGVPGAHTANDPTAAKDLPSAPTPNAENTAATPNQQTAEAAKPPTAAAPAGSSPTVPAVPGDYVIDFVSRPNGATISIDEHSVVAPGELNIGPITNRVKVIATKEGYEPSSAWVDRAGFTRVSGVFRRRVYMTLPVEAGSTAAPGKKPHSP